MKRLTRLIITVCYHFAQFFGMLAFFYDTRLRRVRIKLWVTVYSGIMTIIICAATIILLFTTLKEVTTLKGAQLHSALLKVTVVLQTMTVAVAMIQKWTKRQKFVNFLNQFLEEKEQHLSQWTQHLVAVKYFERAVLSKFFYGSLLSMLETVANLWQAEYGFKGEILSALNLSLVNVILTLNVTLFYFAILNINTLLLVVNEDLKRLLVRCEKLFEAQHKGAIRPGALMNQCCRLADEIDALALVYHNLRLTAMGVNKLYEFQGVCSILMLYLNNVIVIYLCSMMYSGVFLYQDSSKWQLVMVGAYMFAFYMDLRVFILLLLDLLEYERKTAQLLNEQQSWIPTLDARLEQSLNNFSLELAAFPLDMKLMGLFELNRPMCFAIFASTVANSLVLMQYDYQNVTDEE